MLLLLIVVWTDELTEPVLYIHIYVKVWQMCTLRASHFWWEIRNKLQMIILIDWNCWTQEMVNVHVEWSFGVSIFLVLNPGIHNTLIISKLKFDNVHCLYTSLPVTLLSTFLSTDLWNNSFCYRRNLIFGSHTERSKTRHKIMMKFVF